MWPSWDGESTAGVCIPPLCFPPLMIQLPILTTSLWESQLWAQIYYFGLPALPCASGAPCWCCPRELGSCSIRAGGVPPLKLPSCFWLGSGTMRLVGQATCCSWVSSPDRLADTPQYLWCKRGISDPARKESVSLAIYF